MAVAPGGVASGVGLSDGSTLAVAGGVAVPGSGLPVTAGVGVPGSGVVVGSGLASGTGTT